jgi:glycerol uptake facilitator-like aquaporin
VLVLTTHRALFVSGAQILGAIAAAMAVKHIIPGGNVLFGVKLAPGVTISQGFFLEMLLTFELVITILMLAGEVCDRLPSVVFADRARKRKLRSSRQSQSVLLFSSYIWLGHSVQVLASTRHGHLDQALLSYPFLDTTGFTVCRTMIVFGVS